MVNKNRYLVLVVFAVLVISTIFTAVFISLETEERSLESEADHEVLLDKNEIDTDVLRDRSEFLILEEYEDSVLIETSRENKLFLERKGYTLETSEVKAPTENMIDETSEDGYPFPEEYPSVEQLHDWYDDLVAENPNITDKIHLGESWEGRDIWTIKISDNVEEEQDEPSVFIIGNLHTREWSTNQVAAYYLWRLVDGYGSNETITWLVDNRQIYVAPMVNPDGYIYDGDGDLEEREYWRKNRNDSTPTDAVGVDLNRNWDIAWEEGNDDPESSTYRGETPFSEYETQHLRDFILDKDIDSYQDLHSHYGTLLIPWAHTDDPSPHDEWYRDMADDMTSMTSFLGDDSQQYSYGQPGEEIGYSAPGGSYDWVYDETGAIGLCYELYTPDSGWEGFYPDEEYIMDINQDVYDSLVYQARISDTDLGDGSEDLYPPSPYLVYGTVEDEIGNEIEGIEVSIQSEETGETLVMETDRNGYYEFNFGNLVEYGYAEGDTFTVLAGGTSEEVTVGDEWGTRKDLVIESGEVDDVIIYPEEDQVIEAGEELEFDAEAYDEDGDLVEDDPEEFDWLNADDGLFYEEEEGIYDVTATYEGVTSPITQVTVVSGDVDEVVLDPEQDQTIEAGDVLIFDASAYDEGGNLVTNSRTDFDWDTATRGVFNRRRAGEYEVTASYQGVTSEPTTITVESSDTARVEIVPEMETVDAGDVISYTATAYDDHENEIGDVSDAASWSIETGAGGSWAGSDYTSESAGTWIVEVEYEGETDTAFLTVEPGQVAAVELDPSEDQTIVSGEKLEFSAAAYDDHGNLITKSVDDFEWEEATRGIFYQTEPGGYEVTASYGGVSSEATTVTIEEGEEEVAVVNGILERRVFRRRINVRDYSQIIWDCDVKDVTSEDKHIPFLSHSISK